MTGHMTILKEEYWTGDQEVAAESEIVVENAMRIV